MVIRYEITTALILTSTHATNFSQPLGTRRAKAFPAWKIPWNVSVANEIPTRKGVHMSGLIILGISPIRPSACVGVALSGSIWDDLHPTIAVEMVIRYEITTALILTSTHATNFSQPLGTRRAKAFPAWKIPWNISIANEIPTRKGVHMTGLTQLLSGASAADIILLSGASAADLILGISPIRPSACVGIALIGSIWDDLHPTIAV